MHFDSIFIFKKMWSEKNLDLYKGILWIWVKRSGKQRKLSYSKTSGGPMTARSANSGSLKSIMVKAGNDVVYGIPVFISDSGSAF